MTVGYSAAGSCWETAQQALDAYYSAMPPVLSTHYVSTTQYHVVLFPYKSSSDGSWSLQKQSCTAAATPVCTTYQSFAPLNVVGSCTLQPSAPSGLPADFDYTVLGALFAFSFSVVVGLWFFGRASGSVVNIFKPK